MVAVRKYGGVIYLAVYFIGSLSCPGAGFGFDKIICSMIVCKKIVSWKSLNVCTDLSPNIPHPGVMSCFIWAFLVGWLWFC
jgi:hypothetical protein